MKEFWAAFFSQSFLRYILMIILGAVLAVIPDIIVGLDIPLRSGAYKLLFWAGVILLGGGLGGVFIAPIFEEALELAGRMLSRKTSKKPETTNTPGSPEESADKKSGEK